MRFFPLPAVNLWYPNGNCDQRTRVFLTRDETRGLACHRSTVPTATMPSPENLLQEYNELRERFQRTTNALGLSRA